MEEHVCEEKKKKSMSYWGKGLTKLGRQDQQQYSTYSDSPTEGAVKHSCIVFSIVAPE